MNARQRKAEEARIAAEAAAKNANTKPEEKPMTAKERKAAAAATTGVASAADRQFAGRCHVAQGERATVLGDRAGHASPAAGTARSAAVPQHCGNPLGVWDRRGRLRVEERTAHDRVVGAAGGVVAEVIRVAGVSV